MEYEIIRRENQTNMLLIPSHERGHLLVQESRGMSVLDHLGKSAVLGEISPNDVNGILAGDYDTIAKYVNSYTLEAGVFRSVRPGHDFSLRRERDGSGYILGGRSNTLRELAPVG